MGEKEKEKQQQNLLIQGAKETEKSKHEAYRNKDPNLQMQKKQTIKAAQVLSTVQLDEQLPKASVSGGTNCTIEKVKGKEQQNLHTKGAKQKEKGEFEAHRGKDRNLQTQKRQKQQVPKRVQTQAQQAHLQMQTQIQHVQVQAKTQTQQQVQTSATAS